MSMSLAGGVSAGGIANAAIGVGVGVASLATGRVPASIRCLSPFGLVIFDFNPEKVEVKRTATITHQPSAGGSLGSPSGASGSIAKQVQLPDITINNILFEGALTKASCDQLLKWMSPPASGAIPTSVGDAVGAALSSALPAVPQTNPPVVTFQWGPPLIGFMYDVMIKSCSVSYTRFTPTGIPIRALVSLTMEQQPNVLSDLPTNPTSGGRAGRRTHVIKSGDTVQSIATAYYGRPGLWRRVAEVNRMTNPTRLRPGQTVYLPNMDELTEGAP
jgi:Contractile injection system tube protein/LysM domain